jgi:uncharacterized protein with HEPN domain
VATSHRSLHDWLSDIVLWGRRIELYTANINFDDFNADLKTQLAVIKCLEVIGEASARIANLEPDLEKRSPKLELAEAYRMRNRLIHGYFGINVSIVWNAAKQDVPDVLATAQEILDAGDSR